MIKKKTILVVEDSKIQLELLRRILHKKGYDVITASNGRLGLDIALLVKPDLIISDITMPVMSGYELCKEIKANRDISRIPVILLTEMKSVADIIEGLKSQSDDYITKPYHEHYLLSKIESYFEPAHNPVDDATTKETFEITHDGKSHLIHSSSKKLFNLLISTYENVIHQYHEILDSKNTLQKLNNELLEQTHMIKQSEEMFKFFVQTIPDVIYKIDIDGKFTFINNAIRNYGYEPEELIGQHFSRIIHVDDVRNVSRSEILPHFLGVLTGDEEAPKLFDERRCVDRKTSGLELRIVSNNPDVPDSPVIAEVSSFGIYNFHADKHISTHQGTLGVITCRHDYFLGSGGIIKDITEKKYKDKMLFELERLSHALMENACDAILIADIDGNLINVNKKAVELTGYSKSELLDMKYTDIHPHDEVDKIAERLQFDTGVRGHRLIETQISKKDGGCVPVEISANIIDINGKKLLQGIYRDLTSRRRLQEKLRRQEQLLIHQSKMAAMGEMIALIAHQWRQPLNAIALTVQDLKDAHDYGELNDKYVNRVVCSTMDQLNFMSRTIDDFRNFLLPTKEKVRFDVKSAIDELVSMFSQLFQKSGVDISVMARQDTRMFANGYPNEFKQVILNMLNNSRDAIVSKYDSCAIKKWGQIEITLDSDRDGDKIIISIKDTGGGVPESLMEKIFEPYFTTKKGEGTGIGLYMSKTIIETNMGGTLAVRNVEGGAEFIIGLNVSKAD